MDSESFLSIPVTSPIEILDPLDQIDTINDHHQRWALSDKQSTGLYLSATWCRSAALLVIPTSSAPVKSQT